MNLQVHTWMNILVLVVVMNCPEIDPVLHSEFGYQ